MKLIRDLLLIAAEEIDKNYNEKEHSQNTLINTNPSQMEFKKLVFEVGKLYWLPSEKKSYETSILLNAVLEIALTNKLPVIVFTQSKTITDLTFGLIAQFGHIPLDLMKTGQLADCHWEQLINALGILVDADIYICTDEWDITNLIKHIKNVRFIHDQVGLIAMDNLHLMNLNMEGYDCSFEDLLEKIGLEFNSPVLVSS